MEVSNFIRPTATKGVAKFGELFAKKGVGVGIMDSRPHNRRVTTANVMSTPGVSLALPPIQSSQTQRLVNISMLRHWADVDVEELTVFGRPWQYRGEGNANIVIALQDELRVLRLSKMGVGVGFGSPLDNEQIQQSQRRRVEREVAFANSVFIPLLGVEYVGHVQAVHMAPQHIQQLNQALQKLRPVYRLHKELRIPFATAHRDFARIHPYPSTRTDYCVEVKPKQGWWPKHLKNSKFCTYCLNQFLKLERSKIASRTEYCPLDLFSGIPERMIGAIYALISNPQNNLRLFKDGLLVYGEHVGGADTLQQVLTEWIQLDNSNHSQESPSILSNFVYLLLSALLKPKRTRPFSPVSREFDKLKTTIGQHLLISNHYRPNPIQFQTKCCNEESVTLPEGSILSRILDIQKMADIEGGVDTVYSLHSRICPVHSTSTSTSTLPHHHTVGPVIQNLGDVKKVVHNGKTPSSCSSCSSTSSTDDVFELDLDSSSNGSRKKCHNHHHHHNQKRPTACSIAAPKILEMRLRGSEDDEESSGSGCGGDPGSETSGLSSLSQGEDEEDEDETLREELKCPGPHCLSVEKWLDELGPNKLTANLSEKEIAEMESYLIAATAKDCSIMITFSPIYGERARERTLSEAEADSISTLYSPTSPSISNYEDSDLILQDLNGTFHRVRIGVADLDPKPVSCIVKHFLRDRDMLADFNAFTAQQP